MDERAKKRSVYLLRKASAGTMVCVGLALFMVFGLIALAFGVMTLAMTAMTLDGFGMGVGSVMTAVPGAISYLGIRIILSAHNGSIDMPHVPPVAEQIAALPSEEILLRGSDLSAAAPGELLRAAHDRTSTPAEELLRADKLSSDVQTDRPTRAL